MIRCIGILLLAGSMLAEEPKPEPEPRTKVRGGLVQVQPAPQTSTAQDALITETSTSGPGPVINLKPEPTVEASLRAEVESLKAQLAKLQTACNVELAIRDGALTALRELANKPAQTQPKPGPK